MIIGVTTSPFLNTEILCVMALCYSAFDKAVHNVQNHEIHTDTMMQYFDNPPGLLKCIRLNQYIFDRSRYMYGGQ